MKLVDFKEARGLLGGKYRTCKSTSKKLIKYIQYPFLTKSNFPEIKFVIFGRDRSGSTALVDLLNSHSDICCEGELLNQWMPVPRFRICVHEAASTCDIYGFKLLSYQLRDLYRLSNPNYFLQEMNERGYKFIFLTRENILRYAISNIAARKNKFHYFSADEFKGYKPFIVDIEELYTWIQHGESLAEYERACLTNIPHLKITYENNIESPDAHQITCNQIFEFIQVEARPVKTRLLKGSSSDLSELIINHENVIRELKSSKYSHLLN